MRLFFNFVFCSLLLILLPSFNADAGVSASIRATATVIDPVGLVSNSNILDSPEIGEFPLLAKPRSGTFNCQIAFDQTIINNFEISGTNMMTALDQYFPGKSKISPDTLRITVIYTEN